MHAPRRYMSHMWAKHGISSYSYRFNVLPHGIFASACSNHFKEVAFVFNNVDGVGYVELGAFNPFENEPDSYKEIAGLMVWMWTSFVYGLDPNTGKCKSRL